MSILEFKKMGSFDTLAALSFIIQVLLLGVTLFFTNYSCCIAENKDDV